MTTDLELNERDQNIARLCFKVSQLSGINTVSLVYVSSCSNTGSIRDDPYWTSRKNSLEQMELSSTNEVTCSLG